MARTTFLISIQFPNNKPQTARKEKEPKQQKVHQSETQLSAYGRPVLESRCEQVPLTHTKLNNENKKDEIVREQTIWKQ